MPRVVCKRCAHQYGYGPPVYVAPRCPRCNQDQNARVVAAAVVAPAAVAPPPPVAPPQPVAAPALVVAAAPRLFYPPFANAEIVAGSVRNPDLCTGLVLTWVVSGKVDASGKLFADRKDAKDAKGKDAKDFKKDVKGDDDDLPGFDVRTLSGRFIFCGAAAQMFYSNTLTVAQNKNTAFLSPDRGNLQAIVWQISKFTKRETMTVGYQAFGNAGMNFIRTLTALKGAGHVIVSLRGDGNHCVGFRRDGGGTWHLFDPNFGIFKLTGQRVVEVLADLCRPVRNDEDDEGAIGAWCEYTRFALIIVG